MYLCRYTCQKECSSTSPRLFSNGKPANLYSYARLLQDDRTRVGFHQPNDCCSWAMRNAAESVGVECVVDCYIHVDRGMMKNRGKLHDTAYIETARNHVRMLSRITDKEIFDHGMDIVLAEWRCHGENVFADWFQSVYLADDWGNGSLRAQKMTPFLKRVWRNFRFFEKPAFFS
jgi:hypothetical protein